MENPMLHKLRSALIGGELIPPKNRVLVALSGGADSVALLHGLLALNPELGYSVSAAHLNHGIRGAAADSDEAFCRNLCDGWGVPFCSQRIDCPALARERKQSLEEAARNARYAFLEETATSIGARCIATAHHANDQAETVLLNLLRGTGASGLRGMRQGRNNIIRPLLDVTRGEILEYISLNSLDYVQDETNFDTEYTRNHLRALDPQLRQINPAYSRNICRAASLIGEDDDALCAWAKAELAKAALGDGISCEGVNSLPRAVSGRVIRLYAASKGLAIDLSYNHIDSIRALCKGKTGASINLPRGFSARVDYGKLTIKRLKENVATCGYCLPLIIGRDVHTPVGKLSSSLVSLPADLSKCSPFECYAVKEVFDGAVVRPRQPGDYIHPFGAPGKKKLKDYYIDKKIPHSRRNLPVIAVGSEVLWAVGAGTSQKAAIGNQSAVLHLEFLPTDECELD